MTFLSVDQVLELHQRSIELHGGSYGLRDRNLLESAVGRAENKAYYDPGASVAEVGASLGWGLIKNHAFIDGNKRVGFGALGLFLLLNGHDLCCSSEDQVAMVLKAAAGEITEEQWTVWVMRTAVPLS